MVERAQSELQVLTEAEREAIDAAIAILVSKTPLKATWQFGVQNYHGNPGFDVTYFTVGGEQLSGFRGRLGRGSFGERVDAALVAQRNEDADRGAAKQRRIETLRKQLDELEAA